MKGLRPCSLLQTPMCCTERTLLEHSPPGGVTYEEVLHPTAPGGRRGTSEHTRRIGLMSRRPRLRRASRYMFLAGNWMLAAAVSTAVMVGPGAADGAAAAPLLAACAARVGDPDVPPRALAASLQPALLEESSSSSFALYTKGTQ